MKAQALLVLTALSGAFGAATTQCPAATRQKYAAQVVQAYDAPSEAQTQALFEAIPFGVGTTGGAGPGACVTTIIPDGTDCSIPVGTTGQGVAEFGIETRQAFSDVTGQYVNFPKWKRTASADLTTSGTTLINTNVTLGARDILPIPVTFRGWVYIDYNTECRISAVRAYAQVPSVVLNKTLTAVGVPLPACEALPVKM